MVVMSYAFPLFFCAHFFQVVLPDTVLTMKVNEQSEMTVRWDYELDIILASLKARGTVISLFPMSHA